MNHQSNRPVGIAGLGFYVPEHCVTNADLAEKVDTTDEWIKTKIGIEKRYIASKDEALSDLAIKAAERALQDANLTSADIDMLIITGQNHDYKTPATSCIVQHKMGMRKVAAIDVATACSGFIYGLAIGSKFVADRTYENVLVIGAEIHSRMINWQDRSTCVFFGDGAGAAVLRPARDGYGFLSFDLGSDGSGHEAIIIPAGGSRHPLTPEALIAREEAYGQTRAPIDARMDGKAVYAFATGIFPRTIRASLERANLGVPDVDFVISHQANKNIVREGMTALGLEMNKTYLNLERYGNCSSASIPIALREALDAGLVKADDTLVLVGFGAGLSWGSAVMRWA